MRKVRTRDDGKPDRRFHNRTPEEDKEYKKARNKLSTDSWRIKFPEKYKKYQRDYHRKWYQENKERLQAERKKK